MEKHITILGILFIIVHIIAFFSGMILLLTFIGAGMLSSAIIDDINIFPWMPLGMLFKWGVILGGGLLIISLPGIITGLGLTKLRSWARIPGIIIALVHLMNNPKGTIFAVYALWVLLSKESAELLTN
jgi:hypothetical protein